MTILLLTVLSGVLLIGCALTLGELSWFRAPSLVDRLRPYAPASASNRHRRSLLSAASVRDVVGPLATNVGNRLSSLLGVNDDLTLRLRRAGSSLDATGFRMRQVAWATGTMVGAGVICTVLSLSPLIAVAATFAAPLLSFLVLEHRVTTASQRWQETITLELPIVIEQLGMLLSSGYSLGGAINRMGRRGRGFTSAELANVSARMRQGVGEIDALREWAAITDVPAVERLVGVLALNWEASDLGSLIAAEARSVRRDVQRAQIEFIERRAQQVWIPVTVATLVPGVIFMAVPFLDAMNSLTGR